MTSLQQNSHSKSIKKVMIVLQDHGATGTVYVKISEPLPSKDILIEAMSKVEDGLIYADEECTELIDDEYIEILHRRTTKRNEGFVFLIPRSFAYEYIVSVKIIK
jgi:arsenate reductase-like glutaredoxin family protein